MPLPNTTNRPTTGLQPRPPARTRTGDRGMQGQAPGRPSGPLLPSRYQQSERGPAGPSVPAWMQSMGTPTLNYYNSEKFGEDIPPTPTQPNPSWAPGLAWSPNPNTMYNPPTPKPQASPFMTAQMLTNAGISNPASVYGLNSNPSAKDLQTYVSNQMQNYRQQTTALGAAPQATAPLVQPPPPTASGGSGWGGWGTRYGRGGGGGGGGWGGGGGGYTPREYVPPWLMGLYSWNFKG